ncbi:MAG: hypothetical protein U1F42_08800 [Candidatus Competibacteraceae bacterium]
MNQATHTAGYNLPDSQFAHDSDSEPTSSGFDLVKRLKQFALYMVAVTVACGVGLYFLWQILSIQELPAFLKNPSSNAPHRPLTAAVAPPILSSRALEGTSSPKTPLTTTTATAAQALTPASDATATALSPTTLPPTPGNPTPAAAPESPSTPVADQTESTLSPGTVVETAAENAPPPTPPATIEQLLTDAQQQMSNRRLTAPSGSNALQTYQRILELQPNHPTALDGIQRIANYYLDVAQQNLQQGRFDESMAYINRGLRAVPKHQALLNLRKTAQQAKQREQEQQQALVENTRRQQQAQQQAQQSIEAERQAEERTQERPRQRTSDRQSQPWWQQASPQYNNNDSGGGFNQR